MSRNVIVCADDFARDESTSAAILSLVEAHRLSAVSCFTDSPLWPEHGMRLRAHRDDVYLGVHFNLTEPFGHGERPLTRWIARALFGTVDRQALRAHLGRQVDAFARVVGRLPDYIDGHEHVHAFPGVRDVVHAFVTELRQNHPVQIRALTRPFGKTDAPLKRLAIQALARVGRVEPLGAAALNTAFGGDYSLRADADYARLFASWLAAAPDGALIMCHPDRDPAHSRYAAGQREYEFLTSELCGRLLAGEAMILGKRPDRFRDHQRLTMRNTGTR